MNLGWDLLLGLAGTILVLSLIPTLKDMNSYVPRATSIPTTVSLWLIIIALMGLGSKFGASTIFLNAVFWTLIMLFRGNKED